MVGEGTMRELYEWSKNHQDAVVMFDTLVDRMQIKMRVSELNRYLIVDEHLMEKKFTDILTAMYEELERERNELIQNKI